jgi:hypothetical protein
MPAKTATRLVRCAAKFAGDGRLKTQSRALEWLLSPELEFTPPLPLLGALLGQYAKVTVMLESCFILIWMGSNRLTTR